MNWKTATINEVEASFLSGSITEIDVFNYLRLWNSHHFDMQAVLYDRGIRILDSVDRLRFYPVWLLDACGAVFPL